MPEETLTDMPEANQIHSEVAKKQTRGTHGQFIKKVVMNDGTPQVMATTEKAKWTKDIPPLVRLEVSSPITYLKLWWNKVMNNEGIDLRFRIRPLTAMALVAIFAVGGFGLGRLTIPVPEQVIKYIPQLAPTPTPDPWKETAYIGMLQKTGERFYLLTEQAEAISLTVPANVSLAKYLGKRILAVGKFNTLTGGLQVTDAADLEIVIQSAPVPTAMPSATPTGMNEPG